MSEALSAYFDPATLVLLATSLGKGVLTLIVGYTIAGWAQRFVTGSLDRAKVDQALGRFFGSMARYVVVFATLIAAAEAIGFQTTSLLAIFASAGLAVGLALQGSLSNFAAGVMILFFRPFTMGDVITVTGFTGRVTEIGLFATNLMMPDGTKVVVPNASITGSTVANHTTVGSRRGTVNIGVAYGEDLDKVREALVRAAEATTLIDRESGGYAVAFVAFGGSSLDWQVHAFATPANFLDMLDMLKVNVYNELNASGIEIPFPQMVLHKAPEA